MKKILSFVVIFILLMLLTSGGMFFAYKNLLFPKNYIINRDINSLKFITMVMDIDGGCKTEQKPCFYYFGQYRLKKEDTSSFSANIYVEQHFFMIGQKNFISELENGFSVKNYVKEKFGDKNYIYKGENDYKRLIVSWRSGAKLIAIESYINIQPQYQDYFDDLVRDYLEKYPSSIK